MSTAGKPAFPSTQGTTEWREGITIRDYFAAKAMQGLISNFKGDVSTNYEIISAVSYEMADVMLEEREK
jgi:hypothetical protein